MVGICCHPRLYKESKTGSKFSAGSVKAIPVVLVGNPASMLRASPTGFHKNAQKTPSHIIIYQVYHILSAVSITKLKKLCYKFFTPKRGTSHISCKKITKKISQEKKSALTFKFCPSKPNKWLAPEFSPLGGGRGRSPAAVPLWRHGAPWD